MEQIQLNGSKFFYRVTGTGKPLLLVHGWPFHSETYNGLTERLKADFRCYAVDLPGLGKSEFSTTTDFSFTGHAATLHQFAGKVIGEDYACIAHDTGATVARFLALKDPHLKNLILLNTEIPGHRPPWVEMHQLTFALPGAKSVFRLLLKQQWFIRSGAAYGGCFENADLLNDDFRARYIDPLLNDDDRLEGVIRYLRAIDFKLMDTLRDLHRKIGIPVSMIWGKNDPTFPEGEARGMAGQFPDFRGFRSIDKTKLMLHMEKPGEVAQAAMAFLGAVR